MIPVVIVPKGGSTGRFWFNGSCFSAAPYGYNFCNEGFGIPTRFNCYRLADNPGASAAASAPAGAFRGSGIFINTIDMRAEHSANTALP